MLLSVFLSSNLPKDSPMYYIYSFIFVFLSFLTFLIPGSFAPITIFIMRLYLSLLLPLTDEKTLVALTTKLYEPLSVFFNLQSRLSLFAVPLILEYFNDSPGQILTILGGLMLCNVGLISLLRSPKTKQYTD
jgi:hypothetical protein